MDFEQQRETLVIYFLPVLIMQQSQKIRCQFYCFTPGGKLPPTYRNDPNTLPCGTLLNAGTWMLLDYS